LFSGKPSRHDFDNTKCFITTTTTNITCNFCLGDIEDPDTYKITKFDIPDEKPVDDTTLFIVVEYPPEFIGGVDALYQFLGENMVYPAQASAAGISGTAYIAFVVEKDGSITNVEAERGPAGGCTEEAIRVVKLMPKWKPGIQRTKKVRVRFVLPVEFNLQ